jgi:hypothetical protein
MNDTTQANTEQPAKKLGRPRKADPQRVDYHQLDTLLVMGEMRVDPERGPVTEYPSYRELAKHFGISHSLVAAYSSRHNCLRRREAASEKSRKVTDEKVIARRGTALAEAKERILAIIDRFLEKFGKALDEGRVRVDSVADLNIMVRACASSCRADPTRGRRFAACRRSRNCPADTPRRSGARGRKVRTRAALFGASATPHLRNARCSRSPRPAPS